MDQAKGMRRAKREALAVPVELIWKDRWGEDRYATAHTLDISEFGDERGMPVSLHKGSYITIRAEGLRLHGTASVRSCVRQAAKKFRIGLEFSGGLKMASGLGGYS
jgi:hypothetical protein